MRRGEFRPTAYRGLQRLPAGNERGVALLTVMLLMLILTVLGLASVTVSGLENHMAGMTRSTEAAAIAAESCIGTAVNIIQQTIDAGSLPAGFLSDATPAGPVPQANGSTLNREILGQLNNNLDAADGPGASPNLVMIVNNHTVNGDLDRLYTKARAGNAMQMFGGYDGTGSGSAGTGIDIIYRIDCVAKSSLGGTRSRVSAVYACTSTGETCQKQI